MAGPRIEQRPGSAFEERMNSPLSSLATPLRALLGGNVAAIFGAASDRSKPANRIVGRFLRWLEKHGNYKTRVSYCPPLNLLWSFRPDDGSPASILHRTYGRAIWRERGLFGGLRLLAAFLLWPFIVLALAAWTTGINGAGIKRRTGKGIARQVAEQIRLAASDSVPPPWYYIFDLHEDANRRRAGEYLHRYETKCGLFRLIKRAGGRHELSQLRDKSAFAAHCKASGIATVPVFLELVDGEISLPAEEAPRLPGGDLFIKLADGAGGRGSERWDHCGADGYRDSSGRLLDEAALIDHLRGLSKGRHYLVQARVVNHPAMADLSNGALATARIMTCRTEGGAYEVTDAVLRMAVGRNVLVDNFHAGGIAAGIDIATGELGPATDLGLRPERGWCDVHPDTGARIAGRRLPLWGETLAFVRLAHAAFADRAIIGWDVAITPSGPLLIEGNGAPDLDIIQRVGRAPLGNARLGSLLVFHLAAVAE